MKAISVLYRRLTNAEFNATSDIVSQENGGGQTYFDFPKGSVSDEELLDFFDMISPQSIQNGYEWDFKINNLKINISQNATISARRASSNSLRNQQIGKESRLKIFNPENGFPTQYDESSNPLVIYIIKDDTNSYWAGWFYPKDYKPSVWYMTVDLAQMWDAKKSCGCIRLQEPIIFSQHESGWTFGKSNSSYQNVNFSTLTSYDKYLRALRTKPFMLLAGISGTGKSRIVRELAFKSCPEYLQDKDKTTPGNYCMIEVKPNWHDSSEIIGYYSNINKQYQFSRFVKFLVKAMMFPKVPFFVCLDEMNLAPVEQYFAEFLSILETRKKSGDNIQTGVLVEGRYFHEIGVTGCKNNGEVYMKLHETNLDYVDADCATATSLIENGLTLPDNVFVIGTVNMDDTTHQFSRKVIDRAMTIEMNGGKLSEMFGHSSDLEYLPEEQVWKLDIFQPKHVNADEVVAHNPDATQIITEELPKQLDAINDVLRDTPFQVSYRVLNEMVIYFSVLVESGMPSEEAKNLAVDQMLLMKILPRIEGDRDMLMLDAQTCRLDKLEPFAVTEETKKKIAEMKNRLNKQEFTRFWP